uniref:Uncharacterized protein n=1 Tax=uncultured alpha proteobacterium EB080_L06A09 TaxID=710794 RepID=E0Y0C4_9PROT|nr:hypothetical protein [uncultured alpha proteobacterium EB080_L06A09]
MTKYKGLITAKYQPGDLLSISVNMDENVLGHKGLPNFC